MAGTKGNKNAEKWTEKEVLTKLVEIWEYCQLPDCNYLLTALSGCDLYSEVWSYWKDKFAKNQIVFQAIKRVEEYLEQKIVQKAFSGKINATAFIFVAKCKFGFQEPPQRNEHTGADGLPLIPAKITVEIIGQAPPVTREEDIQDL